MVQVSLYLLSDLELMIKKATALDFSKASGPNYIPVVAVTNCEPELLYILVDFINFWFMESCFKDYWKVLSVIPVLENVG